MNREELGKHIEAEIKRIGSQRKAAKEWGVTPNFLWYVLAGKRDPGEKLLDGMGISKVVEYRKKGEDCR